MKCPTVAGLMLLMAILAMPRPAWAAFHLWHVKEVFSNADGSVQFIELFNSFNNEHFVSGHRVFSNSDGIMKSFTLLPNLPSSTTANRHLLIATPGFADLPGGVTPNYTLPDPAVSGPFFDPNSANISIRFDGSNDTMAFTGATLPKDGMHSLTDNGASGSPPGSPNIVMSVNSPTNFAGVSGSVNLPAPVSPTGDYNGNGQVDAADYVAWRSTLDDSASAGGGADGSGNGTIDQADYDFWRARFGSMVPGVGSASSIPEPATITAALAIALTATALRRPAKRRTRRSPSSAGRQKLAHAT